jgi:hypothetical protein
MDVIGGASMANDVHMYGQLRTAAANIGGGTQSYDDTILFVGSIMSYDGRKYSAITCGNANAGQVRWYLNSQDSPPPTSLPPVNTASITQGQIDPFLAAANVDTETVAFSGTKTVPGGSRLDFNMMMDGGIAVIGSKTYIGLRQHSSGIGLAFCGAGGPGFNGTTRVPTDDKVDIVYMNSDTSTHLMSGFYTCAAAI